RAESVGCGMIGDASSWRSTGPLRDSPTRRGHPPLFDRRGTLPTFSAARRHRRPRRLYRKPATPRWKVVMTPQESDLITTLLSRLKSTAGQPKDPDADRMIRQAMAEQPDAPYYLVQTVLIQDLSLHQAQARIAELEKQVSEAQSKPTSFLGGLFGRSQPEQPSGSVPSAGPWSRGPQVAPPPQPQYAQQPGYAQPGYGPGGGG